MTDSRPRAKQQLAEPSPVTGNGLTETDLLALIRKTPFAESMGVCVTHYGRGQVELIIPVRPLLRQHHGFVHGAAIGFVADSACAWSAASVLGDVVTAEYKLNLLSPAVGEYLVGRGTATLANARNAVCRAEVIIESRGREKLVAMAQATVTGLPAVRRASEANT